VLVGTVRRGGRWVCQRGLLRQLFFEDLPEIRLLNQCQEDIDGLWIKAVSPPLPDQQTGRLRAAKTVGQVEHLGEMQNTGCARDVGSLEAIGHAPTIPAFPLEAQGLLNMCGEAQASSKKLGYFAVTAHRLLHNGAALSEEREKLCDATGEMRVQAKIAGEPADHIAHAGGVHENHIGEGDLLVIRKKRGNSSRAGGTGYILKECAVEDSLALLVLQTERIGNL